MTVSVKIEKNVYGGDGLGRLGDGRVCFVPGAFAGEVVKAEITGEKKRYVTARVVEFVEKSPDRTDPGLTVPGMVYAPISYAAELKAKQDQLENFLWKVESAVLPLEVIPAPAIRNYRNKAVYHTAFQNGKLLMGYRAERSHEIVDLQEDPLAVPEINAALPGIRASVTSLLTQGARAVRRSAAQAENVTVRWTKIDGVKWWLGEAPRDLELREITSSLKFRVSADGFYQVNPRVGEMLVKEVTKAYLKDVATASDVLDLYCGVGVFGIACLKGAPVSADGLPPRLTGIESGRLAVQAAKHNAEDAHVRGNFFCERVGGSLNRIRVGRTTTVIVDPPRGGLEANVAPWLAKSQAPRIFYVSCDPATLTRDLSALRGNYRICRVCLFDMFPRTARFETFVELKKRELYT